LFAIFLEVILLSERNRGKMTVEEAGRMGGQKTSETHGPEFYSEIGSKGGQKVRRLIREGKAHERE
jgi:general stress protein YciG